MATSQNGWPVLSAGSALLHTWAIPTARGEARVRLRNGSVGFLLSHYALWFDERIERIVATRGGVLDDWGYANRAIRGSTVTSNHASGSALDLNATRHPLGRRGTFTDAQEQRIRARLAVYGGTIAWGGDFRGRVDAMHVEIARDLRTCESVARRLLDTDRGRRVAAANPGQREVVLS